MCVTVFETKNGQTLSGLFCYFFAKCLLSNIFLLAIVRVVNLQAGFLFTVFNNSAKTNRNASQYHYKYLKYKGML